MGFRPSATVRLRPALGYAELLPGDLPFVVNTLSMRVPVMDRSATSLRTGTKCKAHNYMPSRATATPWIPWYSNREDITLPSLARVALVRGTRMRARHEKYQVPTSVVSGVETFRKNVEAGCGTQSYARYAKTIAQQNQSIANGIAWAYNLVCIKDE